MFGVVGAVASASARAWGEDLEPVGIGGLVAPTLVAAIGHDRRVNHRGGFTNAGASGAGDVMGGAVFGFADEQDVAVTIGEDLGAATVPVTVPGVLGPLCVPTSTRARCRDERAVQQRCATRVATLELPELPDRADRRAVTGGDAFTQPTAAPAPPRPDAPCPSTCPPRHRAPGTGRCDASATGSRTAEPRTPAHNDARPPPPGAAAAPTAARPAPVPRQDHDPQHQLSKACSGDTPHNQRNSAAVNLDGLLEIIDHGVAQPTPHHADTNCETLLLQPSSRLEWTRTGRLRRRSLDQRHETPDFSASMFARL